MKANMSKRRFGNWQEWDPYVRLSANIISSGIIEHTRKSQALIKEKKKAKPRTRSLNRLIKALLENRKALLDSEKPWNALAGMDPDATRDLLDRIEEGFIPDIKECRSKELEDERRQYL